MDDILTKLKTVYIPFLVVLVLTPLTYGLLRWLLDIQFDVLTLKQDLWNYWIAVVVSIIPVATWIRPRIRILSVRGREDRGHFGYQLVMVMAVAAPTVISQTYMESASFGVVEARTVEELQSIDDERFFQLDDYEVVKASSLSYATAKTSGKYNESLTFYLFFSCPFDRDSRGLWYGIKYQKTISNRVDDATKEAEWNSFVDRSLRQFEDDDFQGVSYFEKLPYSDDKDGYLEAVRTGYPSISEDQITVLEPRTGDFESRLGSTLPWVFYSSGIGMLVIFLMVVIPKIDRTALASFREKRPVKDDDSDLHVLLEAVNPFGRFKVMSILIDINIMVFAIMVFSGVSFTSPTSQDLLDFGGNNLYEIAGGESWRLLTSVFVHAGLLHLLYNMFGLGVAALFLEPILKSFKLLVTYLSCGVVASCTSVFWHDNGVGVGASGAIFGLFGAILALTITRVVPVSGRKPLQMLAGSYVGISLLLGALSGFDNAAHIGGLLCGFIVGLVLSLTSGDELRRNTRDVVEECGGL